MIRSFIALAGLVLLAGCNSSTPQVRFDGPLQVDGGQNPGNAVNGGVPVALSKPYEFPFRTLCTATGHPIKIQKVSPWKSDGKIKVVDWGIRVIGRKAVNGPNVMGDQSTVAEIGGFTTDPVTVRCGNSSPDHTVQQFYVSLASSSHTRTTIKGVTVHYGDSQAVNVQFALAFCEGTPHEQCTPPTL